MKPPIQFATAPDGVRLAFYTLGSGIPLVFEALFTHVGAEWETSTREIVEGAATGSQVIRFNHRGTGLSDHGVALTVDGWLSDISAVADKLGLKTFVLLSLAGANAPIALHYAARYPERVSQLVIANARLRMARPHIERIRQLLAMPDLDWRSVSETSARFAQGWDDAAGSAESAWLTRQSVGLEEFRAIYEFIASWDGEPVLSQIEAPTLVMTTSDATYLDQARTIASTVRDAEIFVTDDRDQEFGAVARFIARHAGVAPPTHEQRIGARRDERGGGHAIAVILFADVADSTGLTERMGDTAYRKRARVLEGSLRALIRDEGGTAIEGKLLGDGVLATFPAAAQAIRAALRCGDASQKHGMPLHLGLHAGDVIHEADNIYGGAVNTASRISGLSRPGEVLVSRTVRDLGRTSAGVTFEDRGEHELKGVAERVQIFSAYAAPQ